MARRFAALFASLALLTGPLLLVVAAAPANAAAGDAIQRLGACMAGGGRADVLLTLDTSGSLSKGSNGNPPTDPDDERVRAARFLVEQLARTVQSTDARVDVALSGFADKFTSYGKWHDLSKGADAVLGGLNDFAGRDGGFETDYWQAADGARSYLADKRGNDATRCQAWIWFSDGIYELDGRSGSEADKYGSKKPYGPDVKLTDDTKGRIQQAGVNDLCRAGGVADQLRSQSIVTLAVGLNGGGNTDFSLMKKVATGEGSCGRTRGGSPGEFILADRLGDLYVAFDRISDPTNQGEHVVKPVCQNRVCDDGKHNFVLDDSITRVHIVGAAGLDRFDTVLTAPNGKKFILGPTEPLTQETQSWKAEAVHLSKDSVEINLSQKSVGGWSGAWSLAFVDRDDQGRAMGQSNIRLYGDLKPALLQVNGEPFDGKGLSAHVGESRELVLGLVNADGREVDPANIRSRISLDTSLVLADGSRTKVGQTLEGAGINQPITLDLADASPGNANLELALNVTTRDPAGNDGTQLEPQALDIPLEIAAPLDYPEVPGTVSFGKTDKAGTFTTSLKLKGAGCAWVADSTSATVPDGVTDLSLTSSADAEGDCAEGTVPLELTVGQAGAGLLSGELVVNTLPKTKDGKVVPVTVRYELTMERHRDDTLFGILSILITIAGIAIPVLLLYVVKWSTARFPASSIAVGSVRGPVGTGSSFLTGASITEQELQGVVLAGTDRRSVALPGATLETRMGLGLTEPSYATVSDRISVSSANPSTTRKGRNARLPLSVQDRWIALLDPTDPHNGPVEVVFIVAPAAGKLGELLVDARNRVPDAVVKVRERLGDAPPPQAQPQTDEWGGPMPPSQSGADDWGSAPTSSGSSSSTFDDWSTPPSSSPNPNNPGSGTNPSAPGGGLDDW